MARRRAVQKDSDAQRHFDDVFLTSLPMHFEQFCVFLLNGLVDFARCDDCKRRFPTQDCLQTFCPHLVCGDWHLLLRLHSISKTFWRRLMQTNVGKALRLYAPSCAIEQRDNGFNGIEKRHVRMLQMLSSRGVPRLTLLNGRATNCQRCVCNLTGTDKLLEQLCRVLCWNAKERVMRPAHCACRALFYNVDTSFS